MALLSEKTKKFIRGRRGLLSRIESACAGIDNIVWVHSPSYGEFEEARPILASLRSLHPEYKFLVSFFSPSGYEHLKDDASLDFVFYLPLDGPRNARRFLNAVRPVKAIFCIADFWLFYLNELRRRNIPTYLVSARFNERMSYFALFGRPYINAFRKCFTRIFVNNAESLAVLHAHSVTNCELVGDPRMDRVLGLAAEEWSDPTVKSWADGSKVFVAGSILPDMDSVIVSALANSHPSDKFLVIPHEVEDAEVRRLKEMFSGKIVLYSEIEDSVPTNDAQVLIVNKVGLLSRLYRYGFMAYVGAGFDGAPHSIIEPAAYGIPVCFGPQFGPVWHCQKMIDAGAGFCVCDERSLAVLYDEMKSSTVKLSNSGKAARAYCEKGGGVAEKIARTID